MSLTEGRFDMDIEKVIEEHGAGVRGTLCEHCERLCYAEYLRRFYCVHASVTAVEEMEYVDAGRSFCKHFRLRGARDGSKRD